MGDIICKKLKALPKFIVFLEHFKELLLLLKQLLRVFFLKYSYINKNVGIFSIPGAQVVPIVQRTHRLGVSPARQVSWKALAFQLRQPLPGCLVLQREEVQGPVWDLQFQKALKYDMRRAAEAGKQIGRWNIRLVLVKHKIQQEKRVEKPRQGWT